MHWFTLLVLLSGGKFIQIAPCTEDTDSSSLSKHVFFLVGNNVCRTHLQSWHVVFDCFGTQVRYLSPGVRTSPPLAAAPEPGQTPRGMKVWWEVTSRDDWGNGTEEGTRCEGDAGRSLGVGSSRWFGVFNNPVIFQWVICSRRLTGIKPLHLGCGAENVF